MGRQYLLAFGSACFFVNAAYAYTPFRAASGVGVHWGGNSKFNLAGYPRNNSGLSEGDVFGAVVRGLQRWQHAAQGGFRFDYWQGTDLNVYERSIEYDGLSALHFSSYDPPGTTHLGRNVLGVTQVWYKPESGEILEADVVLNDVDYQFTLNPTDTTGPSVYPNGGIYGRPRVYLENVLTHELGHAVGVSHSGVMESTMLPLEAPEQAYLSCDDQAAARAVYGGAGARIQGRILAPNGQPVFGANVVAISIHRGAVFASAISGPSGEYAIEGLEAGSYAVMVEPFPGSASSLSSFFDGMNAGVCSGRPFSRSFVRDGSATGLTILGLAAGQNVGLGDVRVECSTGASVASSVAYPETEADDRFLFSGGVGAVLDRIYVGVPRQFRFQHPGGAVSFATVAYGIYSPVDPQLEILNAAGTPVAQSQRYDDTFISSSGYRNYDARVNAGSLPAGEYQVRIRVSPVSSSSMPAGQMAADSVSFAVIVGTLGQAPVPGAGLGRCRVGDSGTAYQSPGGNPPRANTSGGGVGFCGRVERMEVRGTDRVSLRRGGPGAGAIASWFMPWALMLAVVRFLRTRVARRTVEV